AVCADEADLLQHLEVLGHGLPGEDQVVVVAQAVAELEEGLHVALGERVEDRSPRRSRQGIEDVCHTSRLGKRRLACKWKLAYSWVSPSSVTSSSAASWRLKVMM